MAGSDTVQSVVRGLDILDLVAGAEAGITLAEISERMAMKPTTVHNLARTLLGRGYLEKMERPTRYVLGPAMLDLVTRQRERRLRQRAVTALRALAEELPHATLTFSEMVAGEVVVSLRLSPQRPGVLEQPVHQVLGAYTSASAILFDALLNDEARAAYHRRYPFAEFGAGIWGTEADYQAQLTHVRRHGYAYPTRGNPSLWRIGAPVFDPVTHELLACLGAAQPTDTHTHLTVASLVQPLLRQAKGLSSP